MLKADDMLSQRYVMSLIFYGNAQIAKVDRAHTHRTNQCPIHPQH